jgi:diguanylate cyclase (GGDEF)-like protein
MKEDETQDRLAQLLALAINLEPVLFDKVLDAATIDELTGAYNQSFFHNGLANELNRAQALRYPLGLLLVAAEPPDDASPEAQQMIRDRTLRSAAAEMVVHSRTTDWTSRSDTNELALVLPGCPLTRLEHIGQELYEKITTLEVQLANGMTYLAEVKIGGVCHLQGLTEVDRLLQLAREAQDESHRQSKIIVRSQDHLHWRQGAA